MMNSVVPLRATITNTDAATPHAWLVCSVRHAGAWMRMHAHEEERLEEASTNGPQVVLVAGGRAEAHLGGDAVAPWAGTIEQRYLELPPMVLARSRWCYKPRSGRWTPFAPVDDEALEAQLTQLLRAAADASESVEEWPDRSSSPEAQHTRELHTADGQYQLHLTRTRAGAVHCEMKATKADSWLGRPLCSVSRGWAGEALPKLSDEEVRVEKLRPSALVLVVHGVGEALWRRENSFRFKDIEESVSAMRGLAAQSLTGAAAARASNSSGASEPWMAALEHSGQPADGGGFLERVEFLAVDWSDCLRSGDGDHAAWAHRLRQVTLTSVPTLREFANDVLCDVLLYEQPAHRRRIHERIVRRINELVRAWRVHHPTFEATGGRIILCGHSLGALISFDVLCADAEARVTPSPTPPVASSPPPSQQADDSEAVARCCCRFHALVTLGSPLGCFLAVRGAQLGQSFELPACHSTIFNIFARNDPVAYRLEPLLLEWQQAVRDSDMEVEGGGRASPDVKQPELPPPVYVPFAGAKTGTRLHIKLRQAWNSHVNEMHDVVNRASTNLYGMASVVQGAMQGFLGAPSGGSKGSSGDLQRTGGSRGEPADGAAVTVRWAINQGARVDYVLQETEFEAANEYLAALKAHNSYFASADIAAFLVHEVVGGVHAE